MERKKSNGIVTLVLGAALFSSGLTAVGSSVGILMSQSKQPEYAQTIQRIKEINKELNVPVHESDLYLKSSYEAEKARISNLEDEYVSLKNIKEKYFSSNYNLLLALWGLSMIPGLILISNGTDKYRLSQKKLMKTAECNNS